MAINECFTNMNFPANKEKLMDHAKANCSKQDVDMVRKLENRDFSNMDDLTNALM